MLESVMNLLPSEIRAIMNKLPKELAGELEEVRIREGRPLELVASGKCLFPDSAGETSGGPAAAYIPGRDDCARLLDQLTRHSLYSFEEELRRGYITVAGGHRVGLAGRTVLEGGQVKLIKDITGFNLRIARQIKGCGTAVLPHLADRDGGSIHHTLVVSPPQQGKTTLIRDLARLLSTGYGLGGQMRAGRKVALVDERSEIAACMRGVPAFDVGPRTDVMDGCPKAEGMMMMIRSMSPDVMVVDEIGTPEDATAVREAMNAGIRVIATAHGRSLQEVRSRPALKELLDERFFRRFVLLRRTGKGFDASVYDEHGTRLNQANGFATPSVGGTRREGISC
ncbi:stage III sporulation protein AA [Gorillibacterium massiliense]|uniref:stage III sporulation protein AA n=1 Tax=Gorillibacterium massiliense TaxID=1280390 RepID=UPI0004B26EE5|nr:stage III sporulation protein AA [Gorillibacterium massiliense]